MNVMHPKHFIVMHLLAFLWHLLLVFLTRHWLIAVLNGGLTVLLGLGLIAIVARLPLVHSSAAMWLRLRRFVVLVALTKGSFYLLQGTSAQFKGHLPIAFGLQFPDPIELLGLAPMTQVTLWNPTTATHLVSQLLTSVAAVFFLFRARQMLSSQQTLKTFVHLSCHPAQDGLNAKLRELATGMGFAEKARLPQVILVEVMCPTPLLLGVWHPSLLLTPGVLAALSPDELEMAFRHELAHFRRHDHWWRWVIAWIEDTGRLNILTAWLGDRAQVLEEELCDRMAIRSAQDAATLANAITKSANVTTKSANASTTSAPLLTSAPIAFSSTEDISTEGISEARALSANSLPSEVSLALPHSVVPFLEGRHTQKWQRSPLSKRLSSLLQIAQEFAAQASSAQNASAETASADTEMGRSVLSPPVSHKQLFRHKQPSRYKKLFRKLRLPHVLGSLLSWICYLLFWLILLLIFYSKFQILIGRI